MMKRLLRAGSLCATATLMGMLAPGIALARASPDGVADGAPAAESAARMSTGVNSSGNGAQVFEELDLRYFANPSTTFYFQPSRLPTYEPNDPYSVNIATFIDACRAGSAARNRRSS